MMFNLPFITVGAVVALYIFIYLRNKQQMRNYKLRRRFWKANKALQQKLNQHKSITNG